MWTLSLHQPQHARCNSSTSPLSVNKVEKLYSHPSPTHVGNANSTLPVMCFFPPCGIRTIQVYLYSRKWASAYLRPAWIHLYHTLVVIFECVSNINKTKCCAYCRSYLLTMLKQEDYLNSGFWGQLGQYNNVLSQNKQATMTTKPPKVQLLSAVSKSFMYLQTENGFQSSNFQMETVTHAGIGSRLYWWFVNMQPEVECA